MRPCSAYLEGKSGGRKLLSLLAGCCVICLACGGDDDGGGGSSDAAEHPLRERAVAATLEMGKKACEVAFACGTHASGFSNVEDCKSRSGLTREAWLGPMGANKVEERCLTEFTPLWEACVAKVVAVENSILCEEIDDDAAGFSFADEDPDNSLYGPSGEFPECTVAVDASEARLLMPGCFGAGFFIAPERR